MAILITICVVFILNNCYWAQVDEHVAFGDLAVLDFGIYHAAVPQVLGGLVICLIGACLASVRSLGTEYQAEREKQS
jgi:hypothetical protein